MSAKSIAIFDLEGKEVGNLDLPAVFSFPVRMDVINRAFVALQSHSRSPQGRDPMAGERTTAETYSPPTGRGVARVPRVKGERYSKSGMAGGIASVVHGRRPHPSKAEKVIYKEINRKERHFATASAVAATARSDLVMKRGHKFSGTLPIIASEEIESISKVKDLKRFLLKIGCEQELERLTRRKRKLTPKLARVRKVPVGPLLVLSDSSSIGRYLKSFPGVTVRSVKDLSILDLAPGSLPGRLTVWSKKALEMIPPSYNKLGEIYAS
jgi:large subunit ribosomal protein L4e